jgi:hypothetical protein
MNDHITITSVDQTDTDLDRLDFPSVEDQDWHASQHGDDWHDLDEPIPDDLIPDGTDYDAWPEWTQTERWEPTQGQREL